MSAWVGLLPVLLAFRPASWICSRSPWAYADILIPLVAIVSFIVTWLLLKEI